jgi:DNA-binding NarL/FixJ family response regulator
MSEEPRPTGIIRVLVVDDHDLFRAGLASLLGVRPGIEVVAQASGGQMAVRLAAELRPDVILMDVQMPDLDGPQATRRILSRHPSIRVLVLSVVSAEDDVAAALAAGACGFLAKDTPIDGVLLAVRAAAQGAAWLSPRAAEVVLGRVRRDTVAQEPERSLIDDLSAREIDVLRLIARGLENAAIAEALGISPRTAKNHVSRILAKLGQPSRVQAAVYAVRRGMS